MRHTTLFTYLFIGFIAMSVTGCKQTTASEPATVVPAAVPVTQKVSPPASPAEIAEAFPFDIKLKDADGKETNSKEVFKKNGKPTVLFFWLTTCRPCHAKLNAISPLYPQWQEELDFNAFAISGDFPKNYESFCKQTKSKNWEWDTYIDTDRAFREVLPGNLNGFPQTFIFDGDGKLVYQDKRYRPGDEKRLYQKIKEISNS